MDALTTQTAVEAGQRLAPPGTVSEQLLEGLQEKDVPTERVSQVEAALTAGSCSPAHLLREVFREGLIREPDYLALLGTLMSMEVRTSIDADELDPAFVERIPIAFARRHGMVGLRAVEGVATIITSAPFDLAIVDHVAARLQVPVAVALAAQATVQDSINHAYVEKSSDFDSVLGDAPNSGEIAVDVMLTEDGDLLDTSSRAPVIKLVNMLLFEAVKRRASDVHIQPLAQSVQARLRIDGILYDYLDIPSHLLDEVISRIKVIGQMDIAEKRVAQDGRTTVTIGEKVVDLRISVIPTSLGERAVLRLLDKSARLLVLSELGMPSRDRDLFERLIDRTHGIILVTGPTGSGKSTTLYAALQHLDCRAKNILTLEDPIEYQLPGISQTQVATKKGMSFATGLRAVLRQDPDIIMVGEIRDEETARMAVQSSLTGHLVFSTLHTNDAAGAVARLLDLGIEPYLVASSLVACIAQRLVRTVCVKCKRPAMLGPADIELLQLDATLEGATINDAQGCEHCSMTGYRGRVGVFELLQIDEQIRELIVQRTKASAIRTCGANAGMVTLRQNAVEKLLAGETTVEEVARVTQLDVQEESLSRQNPDGGQVAIGERN